MATKDDKIKARLFLGSGVVDLGQGQGAYQLRKAAGNFFTILVEAFFQTGEKIQKNSKKMHVLIFCTFFCEK